MPRALLQLGSSYVHQAGLEFSILRLQPPMHCDQEPQEHTWLLQQGQHSTDRSSAQLTLWSPGWRHVRERDEEAGHWELLQKLLLSALEMEGSGGSMIPRCLQEPHFWGREMYSSPPSSRRRCKQNIRNTPASSVSHCQHPFSSHLLLPPSCSVFTAQPQ